MTPALKAMVEAMAAEVKRQVGAGEVAMTVGERDLPGDPEWIASDDIDLEKVARAGLAALPTAGLPISVVARILNEGSAPGVVIYDRIEWVEPGPIPDLGMLLLPKRPGPDESS